jgi:hypothetical protein
VRFLSVALLFAGLGLGALAQTAVTVLDVVPGVSLLGAGGAGISVINGAETLYYNPAGLAELPGISFNSFYSFHMSEASYSAFALAFRNVAVAAMMLNAGSIQGYDDAGAPTDMLSYSNTAFVFGFGVSPSDLAFLPDLPFGFSIGAELKALTSNIGGTKGSGFTFDIGFRGALPNMAIGPVTLSDVGFGLSAVNLFGRMKYGDVQETLRMALRLGVSARLMSVLLLAGDVDLGGGLYVGASYSPVPSLALRLGLISRGGVSITAGAGMNVQGFLIDYAYLGHRLGGSHRVSLTIDFSALDMCAISRSLRRVLP